MAGHIDTELKNMDTTKKFVLVIAKNFGGVGRTSTIVSLRGLMDALKAVSRNRKVLRPTYGEGNSFRLRMPYIPIVALAVPKMTHWY